MKPTVTHPLLTLGLLLLLTACGGGGTPTEAPAGDLAVTPPSSAIVEGEVVRLEATPTDPKDTQVTWRTSDVRIAVVDETGAVRGCSPGEVVITATGASSGCRGTARVRVLPDAAFNASLPKDARPFEPSFDRKCTTEACDVTLRVEGIAAHVREALDRRYHDLRLPQASTLVTEGAPALPYYTLHFAVPVDRKTGEPADYEVAVSYEDPRTYEGIRPWPHQPPRWTGGDPKDAPDEPEFTLDEARYEAKSPFPEMPYTAQRVRMGNPWLLEVRVFPVRYEAQTQRLELRRATRIRVDFRADADLVMPRVVGDYTGRGERRGEDWIADLVQNSDLVRPIGPSDLVGQLAPYDDVFIQDEPFDLMIITRTEFSAPAHELARHRQNTGTRVWLAVLSETTYPDAESIRDYILTMDDRNRFECSGGERPHAMTAILLLGDAEWIPPCQGMNVRARADPADLGDTEMTVGTDLYYAAIRGRGDHHPDVAIGRISVDDDDQAWNVVNKIKSYENWADDLRPHRMAVYGLYDDEPVERGTIAASVTFTNGSATVTGSGFEGQVVEGDLVRAENGRDVKDGGWAGNVVSVDSDTELTLDTAWTRPSITDPDGLQVAHQDGQDDWEFVKSAERVRHWMLDQDVDVRFGYDRRRYYAKIPNRGFEGNVFPADLLAYDWRPTLTEIQDTWAEGKDGIILHSDHGHPEGWGHPYFESGDLVNIPVGDDPRSPTWYPIVFNINCDSGFFDVETYTRRYRDPSTGLVDTYPGTDPSLPASTWPPHDESFCEEVLRSRYGGGVASVGASRGSDAGKNDKLIDGLFGALYADYTEGCIPTGPGTRYAFERLGDVVRAAKFRMYIWISTPRDEDGGGSPTQANYNMEIYHLFGDPMLRVRPPVRRGWSED